MADNWSNDAIQFPRLIEEAQAAGAFTDDVVSAMADSMDLQPAQVNELIDRARKAWDAIVAVTPEGPFPAVVSGVLRESEEEA